MTSVIINAGPKLVPFFKTLVIYFLVLIPHSQPGFLAAFLKCLPIASLILFVVWYEKHVADESKQFSRRILIGLVFCCWGDFCLIWPNFFEVGMIFFAVGHFHYIQAFGFKPLNLPLAILTYAITGIVCLYLMPGLTGVLVPGVPVYSAILTTMLWRACARLKFDKKTWSWSKLLTCIGALSFALSDFLIGVDKFKYKVPHDQVLIMATYYVAQFGMAISIVDESKRTQQQLPKQQKIQ